MCKFPVPTGPNFVVDNMLKVFDTFVKNWRPTEDDVPSKVPANAEDIIMNAIVFAFIWGIGAQIDEDTRQRYDEFLQDIIMGEEVVGKHNLIDIKDSYPEPVKFSKTHLGSEYKSLFDISFEPEELRWINWMQT